MRRGPSLVVSLLLAACTGSRVDPAPAASAAPSASAAPARAPASFAYTATGREVGSAVWSPDGHRLALGIWLLDTSGRRLATFEGRPVAFSPGGHYLVLSHYRDRRAGSSWSRPWDTGAGTWLETGEPEGLSLWRDGKGESLGDAREILGWSAEDATLVVHTPWGFSALAPGLKKRWDLPSLRHEIFVFRLSDDGNTLAHAHESSVHWAGIQPGQRETRMDAGASVKSLRFVDEGKRLFVCTAGPEQLVVSLEDASKRLTLKTTSCSLDPQGRRLLVYEGGQLRLLSLRDGSEEKKITVNGGGENPRWSPDGAWLALETSTPSVTVVNLATGKEQSAAGKWPAFAPSEPLLAVQRQDSVQVLALDGLRTVAWMRGSLRATAWVEPGRLALAREDRWELWSVAGPKLLAAASLGALPGASESFGWAAPVVHRDYLSFERWQRLHTHLDAAAQRLDQAAVLTRRDGRQLAFRTMVHDGREYMVAMDEKGRFFCDEDALPWFQLQDGSAEWPFAVDRRDLLTPALLEEFFGG